LSFSALLCGAGKQHGARFLQSSLIITGHSGIFTPQKAMSKNNSITSGFSKGSSMWLRFWPPKKGDEQIKGDEFVGRNGSNDTASKRTPLQGLVFEDGFTQTIPQNLKTIYFAPWSNPGILKTWFIQKTFLKQVLDFRFSLL